MTSERKLLGIVLALAGLLAWTPQAAAGVPGTRPHGARFTQSAAVQSGTLRPVVKETGRIVLSVDGSGTISDSSVVEVEKPPGATVRRAFLIATSSGFSGHRVQDGEIQVDGDGIHWDRETATAFESHNYFTEVTALVAAKVDAAPAGRVPFTIREASPREVDGVALAVIFDHAALADDATVVLYFGAQDTRGERLSLSLAEPVDTADPGLHCELSLGIAFSFQSADMAEQFTAATVNGSRLTSSAGGQDDGSRANGALFTVGGLDDSRINPDPASPPLDARTDDERYDLVPHLTDGDTGIIIETANPSDDDNLFFAAVTTSLAIRTGETLTLGPVHSTGTLATSHTLTAAFEDTLGNRVPGVRVTFRVGAGPHAGATGADTTDASGEATFTYAGTLAGTDSIRATALRPSGDVLSNVALHAWTAFDGYALALTPTSSSGPVGAQHVLSARLTNHAVPEPGRPVVLEVESGPNTGYRDSATTAVDGVATFAYTSVAAGIDSLVARALIEGAPPRTVTSSRVAREWTETADTLALTLAPASSTGEAGTPHTLTARFTVNRAARAGQAVVFAVFAGPHAGATGTDTTDASGEATFTYAGTLAGTDSIRATALRPSGDVLSNVALRAWTAFDGYALALTPTSSSGPVGAQHVLSARLTNHAVPEPGRPVVLEVESGPNAGYRDSATTAVDGVATFAYTSVAAGINSLVARALIEGAPPRTETSGRVAREWTETADTLALSLAPASSTGEAGTPHTLTARFTVNRAARAGQAVVFAVFAGPHAGATGADTTDASGEATFTYAGTLAGTDSIRATAPRPMGDVLSNVALRAWTEIRGPVALRLDVEPKSCENLIHAGKNEPTRAALLGSAMVDVRDVNVTSLRLEGVRPLKHSHHDASAPGPEVECGCSKEPDKFIDLDLEFDTEDLVAALAPVVDKEVRQVTLTGRFHDGRPLSAEDCIRIIVDDDEKAAPGRSGLGGVGLEVRIPNPVLTVGPIVYRIPADGHVRLVVYDVRGRVVARLVDGFRTAGEYTTTWFPGSLPSGVYFSGLESGGSSIVRRIVLIR